MRAVLRTPAPSRKDLESSCGQSSERIIQGPRPRPPTHEHSGQWKAYPNKHGHALVHPGVPRSMGVFSFVL
jgi:hypothetical protein